MKLQYFSAIMFLAVSFNVAADDGAYWTDSYGNIIRSGHSGECIQTRTWTPEQAVEECEHGAGKMDKDTAKAAPVAAVAAVPADSDADGVNDDMDKCPGSANDRPVDAEGCTIESVVLKNVNFESNSDELTSGSSVELDKAVDAMNKYDQLHIEIQAHTDSMGQEAYNQALSEKRANSVRDYMIDNGIAADRMVAKGYGESKPIADNSTREGRAENRRVELKVIE